MSTRELQKHAYWTNGIVSRASQGDTIRLFCFPFAGGGASVFRPWTTDLSSAIEVYPVQLPGREGRWREPPLTQISVLVSALCEALQPLLQPPYALFGHSMGAFVAFELARQLRRERRPGPAILIVSGARAPQIPDPDPPTYSMPAGQLIEELGRLDGIPSELQAHPELVALLLPMLRADLTLCETYTYRHEPPLACHISVYGGQHDDKVTLDQLSPWNVQTAGEFRLRLFPGKHFFFVKEARTVVTQALAEDLMPFSPGVAKSTAGGQPVPLERVIAGIWRDVLGKSNVGLDDNFFDLGGDSLTMMRAHGKLREATRTTLTVIDLFRYPTIRMLASAIGPAPGRVQKETLS